MAKPDRYSTEEWEKIPTSWSKLCNQLNEIIQNRGRLNTGRLKIAVQDFALKNPELMKIPGV